MLFYLNMLNQLVLMMMFLLLANLIKNKIRKKVKRGATLSYGRNFIQSISVEHIIFNSDLTCYEKIRMDRRAFHILCEMLKTTGKLSGSKNSSVEEMVVMFLYTLARDVRYGETISRQFNAVLNVVLHLHKDLLKEPDPIPENSTDERWKWFKNCLGVLDGTYIKVRVPDVDKPRYRSRKGDIATNVLACCSQDMQLIYVLPGWEGSASDSRILRDAISRRNELEVPRGHYYLCDAGYTNGEGFLAPYIGQRYPLTEFKNGPNPSTPEEFFNMKHSAARNVIERSFGLLKGRWAILRTTTWYPIKTHTRIIFACCLLHNHIRRVMNVDPLELEIGEIESTSVVDRIQYVETSDAWTAWRDDLARQMFDHWKTTDACEELEREESFNDNTNGNDLNNVFVIGTDEIGGSAQECSATRGVDGVRAERDEASSKKNKKRSNDNLNDEMVGNMGKLVDLYQDKNSNISMLARCFTHEEAAAAQRRDKVLDEIMQLEGFTIAQKSMASDIILSSVNKIDFFFKPHANEKSEYVAALLV